MRADGGEKFRVPEREVQCAIASHGDSRDRAIRAAGPRAVARFDSRQEFLHQEILVADCPVMRINVKRTARVRCGNQKFAELSMFPQVFDQVKSAGVDEHLFVVAEPVKKIKNGIFAGFVRVVARGKNYAIIHRMRKDFTG